jgi:2-methylcitrate dehydratase
LPYIIAVALLDGVVGPAQYAPARIASADVQALLRTVDVRSVPELGRRFPDEMPSRVLLMGDDGSQVSASRSDFEGFPTRPMPWASALAKFRRLAEPTIGPRRCNTIAQAISDADSLRVRKLVGIISGREEP